MRRISLVICLVLAEIIPLALSAQQPVNQSDGPPSGVAVQTVYVQSAGATIALCWSPSTANQKTMVVGGDGLTRLSRTVSISAISKANPAVVTSTGHTFQLGTRPIVTISGATGTGWTGVNATWTATLIDANTFSIPIDTTGATGTVGGTITFTTTAPREGVAEWAVQLFVFSGATVVGKDWLGGSSAYTQKCTDATSTTLNVQ